MTSLRSQRSHAFKATPRLVCALLVALVTAARTSAEDASVAKALNAQSKDVSSKNRTSGSILAAFLKMSAPPFEVGEDFNQGTVWQKMKGWDRVSAWAKANEPMGQALVESQFGLVFGLGYGAAAADPALSKAGLHIKLGDGADVGRIEYGYFRAVRTIGAYATAEMYRLGEAGDFAGAFKIGVAHARLLRQVCEQSMLEEKLFGLQNLCEALSIQRDFMYTYLKQLPVDGMKKLALKEYPFLRPSDNEKMQRLKMPEGDRIVTEAVLKQALAVSGGSGVDPDKFAQVVGAQSSAEGSLQRFNTQEMWRRVSQVHGSLEASNDKLLDVYDDWWRRWRVRPFTAWHLVPTEFSRANPIKYAAVTAMIRDMERVFAWRNVAIAEVNGSVMSAGLCGYYGEFKQSWPKDRERAYTMFFQKRYDFDPFDKAYGRLQYRFLGTEREAVETPLGRVWATGCMVWALGANNEDDDGTKTSTDAADGDLLMWPPVRALAREEGMLE